MVVSGEYMGYIGMRLCAGRHICNLADIYEVGCGGGR